MMVLVKATKGSEAGVIPTEELLTAMGKFNEELVAGLWLWRVRSMAEAIEWLERCPNPLPGECEVEIRPVFEASDFAEELTPELRAQEEGLRQETVERLR